jgi:hypothetical protein
VIGFLPLLSLSAFPGAIQFAGFHFFAEFPRPTTSLIQRTMKLIPDT